MRRRRLTAAALAALVASAGFAAAHDPADAGRAPLPEPELLYEPPPPGSYELPPIDHVADHELLGADGASARLLDLEPGEVALVSFVYLDCTDATGCPLAVATLRRVDHALARRPELAARTRLVTVSFDPARDTPARMAALRRSLQPLGDWRFLTAESAEALAPVLADFGQDAMALVDPEAGAGRIRHVLKVFLVDAGGAVRNIYSTGFLATPVLLNDVETVLLETAAAPALTRR